MPTVRIDPSRVGAVITATANQFPQLVLKATGLAAERAVGHLKSISPVDRGMFKNAWQRHHNGQGGWEVQNTAPYAGIMERGARPHAVSAEGWMSIFRWVLRHPELFAGAGVSAKGVASGRSKMAQGFYKLKTLASKKIKHGPIGATQRLAVSGPRQQVLRKQKFSHKVSAVTAAATEITNAIVWKLKHEGQEGHYMVLKNLPKYAKWTVEILNKAVAKFVQDVANNKGKGGGV